MNSGILDKLNLRPQERRLVVIVSIVLFVVVNVWLVWPHFGDLGIWQQRRSDTQIRLNAFKAEIGRQDTYLKQRNALRTQGKPVSNQGDLQMQREVEKHAQRAGVTVTSWSPERRGNAPGKTNQFFEEESLQLRISTGEKELIDFLYGIGSGESLIRVRSLSLQPDGSRMRLAGDLTLVESFQKAAPRTAAAASPTSIAAPARTNAPKAVTPATKPAATPPKTQSSPPRTPRPPPSVKPNPNQAPVAVPPQLTNSPGKVVVPKRIPKTSPVKKETP